MCVCGVQVGYCQGMGFITAMFLSYMPEEVSPKHLPHVVGTSGAHVVAMLYDLGSQDAFFLLLKMLKDKRFELAAMYRPGMPMVGLLHFQFHGLMKKKLPKLCKHLDTQGLHPTIFASQVRCALTSTAAGVCRCGCGCVPDRQPTCDATVVHHRVHVQLPIQLLDPRVGLFLV